MKILNIFFVLLLLLFHLFVKAQPDTILKYIENAKTFQLLNGMKIILIENPKATHVFSQLFFDVEPIIENDYKGFTHATGYLLGSGTLYKSKYQIEKYLNEYSINIDPFSKGIRATAPKENVDTLIKIMAEIAMNSVFDDVPLNIYKQKRRDTLSVGQNDIDTIINKIARRYMFGENHPYGEEETIQTVGIITDEKCKSFYNSWFKPANAYFVLYGDFNSETDSLILKTFSKWKKSNFPEIKLKSANFINESKILFFDKPEYNSSFINFFYPLEVKPFNNDKLFSEICIAVFEQVLRLNTDYKSVSVNFHPDKHIGYFSLQVNVSDSKIDSAYHDIYEKMKNFTSLPIDENILNIAINKVKTDFLFSLDYPHTIADYAMNIERYKLQKNYFSEYLNKFKDITLQSIQNIATNIFKPDNSYIILFSKRNKNLGKLVSLTSKAELNFVNKDFIVKKTLPKGFGAHHIMVNFINAIGGTKNIGKLNDITIVANGYMQIDTTEVDVEWTICRKQPDMYFFRQTLAINDSTNIFLQEEVFDGINGYDSTMQGGRRLEGEELEMLKFKSKLFPEMFYEQFGYKCEFMGVDTLNDEEVYKVKIINQQNDEQIDYFSIDEGFKTRSVKTQTSGSSAIIVETIDFLNYKDIGDKKNIMLPHQKLLKNKNILIFMKISKIDLETKIKKTLFTIKP